MSFTPTALKQARDAGYEDSAIASHLAATDARIPKAIEAGYTLDEVADFLAPKSTEKVSERVMAGIASSAADTAAGASKFLEDMPIGRVISNISKALGQSVTPFKDSASFWQDVSTNSARDYALDPSRDDLFSSKLISGAASIVPIIASGPLAPVTAAAMAGEQGRKDAEANEGGQFEQNTAFYGNAAVGLVTEYLLGVPAVLRAVKASTLSSASAKAIAGTVIKQTGLGAGREALQESGQQTASNVIASSIAQYDKDRSILEGVMDAAIVGGIVGGGLSGAISALNIPQQTKEIRDQLSSVSDTSLKAALVDEDLLAGSPFTKSLIEEELLARDPGYKAEEAGAPLTAEALRTTPIPETQPATEGGEPQSADQEQLPDSTGTVQNRDEQRQGQRQGDELPREGLRPDGGDTAADSSQREDGSPVDAGVRPQAEVTPSPQTEPAPATEAKGAEPPVASEQSKLDAITDLLPKRPRPAPETTVEALKPSKQGLVLQKQLEELQGDLVDAKLAGEKSRIRDLRDEIKAKKEAIAKEAQKTAPAPAAQKPESKPQAESAPSPQAKAEGASSSQTISDVPAMEARIGAILKQRKLSSDDAERTKLWNEAQELDKQIRSITGESPVPPAFKKPSGEGGFIFIPPRKPPVPALGTPPSGKDWLRIPSALVRATNLSLFVEGTADVLERQKNPVAQQLSKAIKAHVDNEQVNFAAASKPLNDAIKGMPKAVQNRAFDELETYMRSRENGRAVPKLSFSAQKILDAWEETAQLTGDMARSEGVQVFDPKTGGYRPMGNLGKTYLPRKFSPEVEQVFRDPEKNVPLWNSLVLALATHKGIPIDVAASELRADAARFQENDFMGNLEMARGEQLPEVFYDYDLRRIASKYIPAFSERLSQIQSYGQRLGDGRHVVQENLFDKAKKETQDQYSKEWLDQVEQQATNFRVPSGFAKFAERGGMLANALLLSSPTTTVLRNMISGTIATGEMFPANSSLRGLVESVSSDAFRDAREMGVIRDNLSDALHADRLGDSPFDEALRTFQNKALKYSGYNGSEVFVRTHAAATASQFAMDAAEAIAKDPSSARSREALALFKRMEVDPNLIVAEMGNWRNGTETSKFIRKTVRENQGGYRFDQLPLWANSVAGRFFYKYGRYGVQRSRSLWRNIVLPLMGTEIEVNGKKMRQYRVAPLVKATAGLVATGELFALAGSLLFDRDRRDASLHEIGETFKEDEKVAIGMAFERAINDVINAGTLGIAGQPLDAYRSLKDQSRLKSPFNPPAMSSTNALLQLGMNAVDQGTVTRRDLIDFAGAFAPGAKQLTDVARNVMDEPLYEAEQDVSTLRAAAKRWGRQAGLDVESKIDKGTRRKSEKAPIFEPIQDALLTGNADLARSLASQYLADSEEPKAALRSMTASVRQRMPFRAGPFSSAHHLRDFYEWAQKHLPEDQLNRTKRVQERYIRAAQKAGLLKD